MLKRFFVTAMLVAGCLPLVASVDGVEWHTKRAVELYRAEKYIAAAEEITKAKAQLTADPGCENYTTLLDYYDALCAAQTGSNNAWGKLNAFLEEYPGSAYENGIRFALANYYYADGNYGAACPAYLAVNPLELTRVRQGEYNYKLGYSYFMLGQYDKAYTLLRQADSDDTFGIHAIYCTSYIEYLRGDYDSARAGFERIKTRDAYIKTVPYYILQIDFLTDNYQSVVDDGDAVIAMVSEARAAEAARIVGESWYRLGNYENTLRYMHMFEELGGQFGRNEYYVRGFANYRTNNILAAASDLEKVCTADDDMTQNASYHLGDCFLQLGKKPEALQAFIVASAGNPDNPVREDALFNYGKLQYELGGGLFSEAINVLNLFLKDYPNSPYTAQAREYLVSAYYNTQDYQGAYEIMARIENPDNNMKAAMQKITYFRALDFFNDGDLDTAYRMLEESAAYRSNQRYTALATYWIGEIMFLKGDYTKAAAAFKHFLSVAPPTEREYVLANYGLGYSYFDIKRWSESREWFNKFVKSYTQKDQLLADAYNRLGDIACQGRSFTEAIGFYEKAAAIDSPQKYYAQLHLALTFGYDKRADRKAYALKDIIIGGKGPYVDRAHYELGKAQVASEKFADASKTLTDFLAAYPESPYYLDALEQMGLVSLNLGNRPAALKYYKQIVDKSPSSLQGKEAMASIREIYVDQNDVDTYFAYIKDVGAEGDLNIVKRDSLAFASAEKVYLSGALDRTTTAMNSYLVNYPKGVYRANALYYLGDSQLRSGNKPTAMASFEDLDKMYFNDFTIRGLDKLGALYTEAGNNTAAAGAYKKLADYATSPDQARPALAGYLTATVAAGDDNTVIAVANEVAASKFADAALNRKALFAKARAMENLGDDLAAIEIFRTLSADRTTPEGAESAYKVIVWESAHGGKDVAKKSIQSFAEQKPVQPYWLAKAFVLLGDIYAAEGNDFQAKATYQSIVDGYTVTGDGITEEVKEKLKALK